jgi:hypothetical protein
MFFVVYSPRAILLREAELFSFMLDFGARINKNPKFVSWVAGGARLGKTQIHKLGCWWRSLEDGSGNLQHKILLREFSSCTICILYYTHRFSIWVILSSHIITCKYFSKLHISFKIVNKCI